MKKNEGFTIVEVLAVIVILGTLMTIGGTIVFTVLDEQKEKLLADQIKGLADTSITYVESLKKYMRDCPLGFDPKNPDVTQKNKCYREVKVQDIIDANFFENKNNLCDPDASIIVYKSDQGSYSELQSYIPEGICSY